MIIFLAEIDFKVLQRKKRFKIPRGNIDIPILLAFSPLLDIVELDSCILWKNFALASLTLTLTVCWSVSMSPDDMSILLLSATKVSALLRDVEDLVEDDVLVDIALSSLVFIRND